MKPVLLVLLMGGSLVAPAVLLAHVAAHVSFDEEALLSRVTLFCASCGTSGGYPVVTADRAGDATVERTVNSSRQMHHWCGD